MNERDVDAEFDAIVARWDAPAPERSTQRPAEPTSPESVTSPQPPVDPAAPPLTVHDISAAYAALSRPEPDAPSSAQPSGDAHDDGAREDSDASASELGSGHTAWREGPSVDDEDDHFEPAPVALPPGEDIGYWGALAGLVGGPLVLIWVVLSSPFYAGWWALGGIGIFLGGFALLVMRMPRHRDPFDDDDGARV